MAKSKPSALQSERTREVYDSPWKEALRRYFEPFLKLLFPAVWSEVDWSRELEFLDKELDQALGRARQGRRQVDLLVRVQTLRGSVAWVLVHVEVQAQFDAGFAARMLTYYHSLCQRYEHPICSLAVLADGNPRWRPSGHTTAMWGCRCEFQFPVAKLLDLSVEALSNSDNPFATFVRAHLATLDTTPSSARRRHVKFEIVRGLYDQGHSPDEIRRLFGLVDWVMTLSAKQHRRFWEDLMRFEEEKSMPYVTSVERDALKRGRREGLQQGLEQGREQGLQQGREQGLEQGREQGLEQGREQGLEQGLRDSLLTVLQARFGQVPDEAQRWIAELPPSELESALRQAVVVSSLDELR